MTPDLARLRQVKSFEGPLEFYYPGQPDMTLVAGSVNVMGPLGSQGQGKEEATITGDGELIGLREKLQENPIFHGKIYGFLKIFP